ncbi:type 4 pilus major pilin [Burkholderia sp. WAC0059]|uniref:type 4 pilus major pilin n=1 Tax=Burkholderia sp. WAC0059 TaxID=2066022 RepID=UPI0015E0AAB1|nr:type 4 pilus major pilin [Burkholderia sp. WAC0059]
MQAQPQIQRPPGTGRPSRRQRGATLLEAIAFLGVAAIVLLGALSLFNSSFTSASSDRLVQETNAIASNVRSLYSSPNTGGYQALSMTDMVTEGVFPTSLVVNSTNSTVSNEWGGTVTVALANGIPQLTYTNVPQSICIRALTSSTNWASITVNSSSLGTTPTIAQAQSACSSLTSNTMAWGFV